MNRVKEGQNNIYYITVRLMERATWNNELGLVSYFIVWYISRPWLVGEQCSGLFVEGRAWTAHTAVVSRECFQYSSLSVSGSRFFLNSLVCEFFFECCFSCLSLGTCVAHSHLHIKP